MSSANAHTVTKRRVEAVGIVRSIITSLVASVALACGPEVNDEPEPPGVLEFEHSYARIYRLDRRIDIVLLYEDNERRECGLLSERAYTELEDTLAPLDPHEDYGYDASVDECEFSPGAWVHIEGFEHSPFQCDFQCCRSALVRAAVIYWLVEYYFLDGTVLEFDGEPYVAIEPDEPCPETVEGS